MTKRRRALILGALAGSLLLAVVGIGSAGVDRNGGTQAASSLRSACGSKIVVQTDWFPEPEHAAVRGWPKLA